MQSNIATIVSNFVLALLALLAHPKTPKAARTLFKQAAVEFIGKSKGGFPAGETLEAALLRAFGQSQAKTETAILTPDKLPEDEDERAYAELGAAFVAIERHRDYLPAALYNDFSDTMQEFINLAQWATDPELAAQIMPLVIRQAVKNASEQGISVQEVK